MRRPKVPILLALLVPLAACGDDYSGNGDRDYGGDPVGETVTLTVDETEAEVSVGDHVVIELDENASIGDDWQVVAESDDAVLDLVDETTESEGDCDGCGATLRRTYTAVAAGETTLELHNCYRCDTDGNSTEEPPEPGDLTFTVEVSS
jgi:hypothetical protein